MVPFDIENFPNEYPKIFYVFYFEQTTLGNKIIEVRSNFILANILACQYYPAYIFVLKPEGLESI
jgi:hypothetical protein